jgi:hypothetical protein
LTDNEDETSFTIDKRKRIDLRARKTEPEWAAAWGPISISLAPKLFEWAGWAFLLGGIRYMGDATGLIGVRAIDVVLTFSLWLYFLEFFYRFEIVGFPLNHGNSRVSFFISLVISMALGYLFYHFTGTIADQIAEFQANS